MKRTFKKLVLCMALLAIGGTTASTKVMAQDVEALTSTRSNTLSRAYLRPSVSNLFVTDGSQDADEFVRQFAEYEDGKFDQNVIASKGFKVSSINPNDKEQIANLQEQIKAYLDKEKVGNQIMHVWFPSFANGTYSTSVLEQRGQLGATDDDVVRAKAAQRGVEVILNELGEKLIDRSYVVVYYVGINEADKKRPLVVKPFVYKLDYSAEVMMDFYKNYFKSADGIDKATFPLKLVYTPKKGNKIADFAQGLATSNKLSSDAGADEVAMRNQSLFDAANVQIGQKVADFQVKAAIVALSPIQAKLGRKENLATDRRFSVYEQVMNDEGAIVSKRRGTVRVGTYIADNRGVATGESTDYTKFYQYAGGKLSEGMTLVENPDLGLGANIVASYMLAGLELDYRASDLIGKLFKGKGSMPGLFVYGRFALPFGTKATAGDKFGLVKFGEGTNLTLIYRYDVGVRKEFNFARLLTASVNAGYGAFAISGYESKCNYVSGGARFGAYVSPSVSIYAMAEYSYFFTGSKVISEAYGISPINFGLGLRFGF